MKRLNYIGIAFIVLGLLSSCSDWLDVRSENSVKEEDQFSHYKGFRDALTGCYMQMADENLYGQRLTMTDIESLASLWFCPESHKSDNPQAYQLHNHLYREDNALQSAESIYAGLYNTIAQANVIIKHYELRGDVIADKESRACIGGEAYAIRAFCHLDVLRLFGQLPREATRKVRLPYSYTTDISTMPAYYDFEQFCLLLEKDLDRSIALLEKGDPVLEHSFASLNGGVSTGANAVDILDDPYFYYRQSRLNYYAVKALKCRYLLYVGRESEAHTLALELINAVDPDGNSVLTLSGPTDFSSGYHGCPGECFFYLSKFDILNVANEYLMGGRMLQARAAHYYLTSDMFTQLYASVLNTTGSHNRYNKLWNKTNRDSYGTLVTATKKYWYDEEDEGVVRNAMTKAQIIPMLRLSELYLIAIETAETLEEANSLYAAYQLGCDVILPRVFGTLQAVRNEMVNEYRREFFAEGQMFYVYKRKGSPVMLWNAQPIEEEDYIIPLPTTEYEP